MNADGIKSWIKFLNTCINRGIHFLYNLIIRPKSVHEDLRRREFILNIILVGFIGLMALLDGFVLSSDLRVGVTSYGTPFWAFTIILLFFIGLLVLSRKGYFIAVSYVLIGLQYFLVTRSELHWGIEIPVAILTYVIIIITASILLGTQTSFFVAGIISITVIVLGYCEIHGITHVDLGWKSSPIFIHDPYEYAGAFLVIVILSWLSNREIERSLRRARSSEAELKMERDSLELKVEERTRELKSMQMQKVAELYRVAEFGKLSTGIFHDLMNPLNAVIANVSELHEHPEHISSVKLYTEKAVAASRRMGDFLSTVRKQIENRPIEESFLANKEVREAIDILKYRAREVGVTLSLRDKKELQLFGNPLKFYQVSLNLISNAIDACEAAKNERGELFADNAIVSISIVKRDGMMQLKVSDRGCGIPEHIAQKMFDPFFTTKEYSKGMGLGLSTTKQIVEHDFKGTLSFASIPNQGATFTALFPLESSS